MKFFVMAALMLTPLANMAAEPPAPRTFGLQENVAYVSTGEMTPYYGLPQQVETHYETEEVPVTRNVTEWVEEEKVVKVKTPVVRQETTMVPRTVKVTTIRQPVCQPCQQTVSTGCCQAASVQPVVYKRALFQRRAARRMQRRATRYTTVASPRYMSACPNGQCQLGW
jgi:hypothetical protein